jgi:hypothetical protein
MTKSPFLAVAWLAMIAPATSQAPAPASFEQGVLFQAADLLPADQLRGASFRVRDQVVTDGFMAHFDIDTDFGAFTAIGVPQVRIRIAEAEAIRKLVETSKSDLFAEGLKRSLNTPIDAVKNIVTKPVETAKQVPKTVGHFFGKIGSSIERGVNKVKDQTSDDAPTPSAGEVGKSIGETAKNVAGFDKARLDTAKQLGVDPYSDNARLQDEMDKVTWAFFAGGLPLRIGAAVASAGVAVAATNMVGVPADTYALTQAEIAHRDEAALTAMKVSAEDIQAFMIQANLSTTRRHRIVTALNQLPKASGRGLVVRLANGCTTVAQADFMIHALDILVARQNAGAADYTSLHVIGRLPAAMAANGELQVPAPVDYVTWTETVAGFAQRDDLGTAPKVLVHTGRLSDAAAAGLKTAGWQTVAIDYPAP